MVDQTSEETVSEKPKRAPRKPKKAAAAPEAAGVAVESAPQASTEAVQPAAEPAPAKARTRRTTAKKRPAAAAAEVASEASADVTAEVAAEVTAEVTGAATTATTGAKKRSTRKKATPAKRAAASPASESPATESPASETPTDPAAETPAESADSPAETPAETGTTAPAVVMPLFRAPEAAPAPRRRTRSSAAARAEAAQADAALVDANQADADQTDAETDEPTALDGAAEADGLDGGRTEHDGDTDDDADGTPRRRRRRGGRRRRKPGEGDAEQDNDETTESAETDGESGDSEEQPAEGGTRRRRRRRRAGDSGADGGDDPEHTVTRVRTRRAAEDEITAVSGSTRLEAKKQRRREGREAGRRRAPIVSEAEFLARRESVERVMVIRQRGPLTQIAVLEDNVLVEHYVAQESQTSLIGNVYLGRVQNVLPSMEAAFIDIGKGRNAVLYAGELNWSALGHKDGQPRKIESVLSSGQSVLVQVTKDPVGHKGARLTSQVSLAGRFLVYVPDGTTSGISRKLPDTERNRLKTLLKEIVPDTAGVIVRTAAEGASEDELTRDVERLKARWEDIEAKVAKGNAPTLLYGEPDLTLKVVRDLFTEDFTKLVIEGADAWETVQGYVAHVAPDLEARLERYDAEAASSGDAFTAYRIDEQIAKGLDRKVWLPSGGSLVIDRTEAMTVVDVNTGKFTGSGGNLEETVTRNNLEAAEEIVRQLRLRDIGGIIVVDFIDMVLESNRDLVLRRLVECLGRDRTRHQVAEVTSLGLVQMTRKRIGTGLLEAFSDNCEHCAGRGVVVHEMPTEPRRADEPARPARRRRGRGAEANGGETVAPKPVPSPRDVAAVARPDAEPIVTADDVDDEVVASAASVEPTAEAAAEVVADGAADSAADGATEAAAETPAEVPAEAQVEAPVDVPAEVPAEVPTVSEPAPPRVVTRTRRRAASRPAGPPAPLADEQVAPVEPAVSPDAGAEQGADQGTEPVESHEASADASVEGEDAPEVATVGHVPIKRKGTRKR